MHNSVSNNGVQSYTVLIVISPLSHVTSCPGDKKKASFYPYTCLGDPLIVVIGHLVKFIVRKPSKALIIVP